MASRRPRARLLLELVPSANRCAVRFRGLGRSDVRAWQPQGLCRIWQRRCRGCRFLLTGGGAGMHCDVQKRPSPSSSSTAMAVLT